MLVSVMEEMEFLIVMTCLTLLAGLCSVVFSKLKMPPIIGYLSAGIIIANFMTIPESSEYIVEILSDIGLVMLMFCIGLEINISKLKSNGKVAIIASVVQLPLMIVLGYAAGFLLGLDTISALTLGAIISGSSTAVLTAVLKLQDKITKEATEVLILVIIIEDIAQVIILSIISPMFSGASMDMAGIATLVVSIMLFFILSVIIGMKFVPRFLNWIGDNTSAEVLLILSVGLCFGLALLSVEVGLSMAIGAFLMGMITSQCKFHEEIAEKVDPMKEMFMAVFFISIGLQISVDSFLSCLPLAVAIYFVFAASKIVTVFLGYFIANENFSNALTAAIMLTSMGEFAFIIAHAAMVAGVVTTEFYTSVVIAALISMIVLPTVSRYISPLIEGIENKGPSILKRIYIAMCGIRSDIYELIESPRYSKEHVNKTLKNSYACIILIVAIELLMIAITEPVIGFVSEMLEGNIELAYLIFIIVNFFILAWPTWHLISNIKYIDQVIIEKNTRLICGSDAESNRVSVYKFIKTFNAFAMVCIVDFLILLFVPGPFGRANTIVVIPIVVAIFLIAYHRSRKKALALTEEANC